MTLPEAKLKSPISIVINPSVTIQNWTEARKKFQDTFIFELRDLDKAASAYVHDVPEVQAASGKETPKRGRVDSRIQIGSSVVAPGTAALEIAIPKASIMPLTLESGSELGLNIIFGDKGKLVSLAPVNGYESPREPGEVKFILAIME
jgi:hypothetical protein